MPELPEVELVAKSLNRLVSGRRISEAALVRARLAPDSPPNEFAERLSGSAIRLVNRAIDLPGASRVARPMIWTTSVRLAR